MYICRILLSRWSSALTLAQSYPPLSSSRDWVVHGIQFVLLSPDNHVCSVIQSASLHWQISSIFRRNLSSTQDMGYPFISQGIKRNDNWFYEGRQRRMVQFCKRDRKNGENNEMFLSTFLTLSLSFCKTGPYTCLPCVSWVNWMEVTGHRWGSILHLQSETVSVLP